MPFAELNLDEIREIAYFLAIKRTSELSNKKIFILLSKLMEAYDKLEPEKNRTMRRKVSLFNSLSKLKQPKRKISEINRELADKFLEKVLDDIKFEKLNPQAISFLLRALNSLSMFNLELCKIGLKVFLVNFR